MEATTELVWGVLLWVDAATFPSSPVEVNRDTGETMRSIEKKETKLNPLGCRPRGLVLNFLKRGSIVVQNGDQPRYPNFTCGFPRFKAER